MSRIVAADADTLLARALVADGRARGLVVNIGAWTSHPWSSATFTGARHHGTLEVAGPAVADWASALSEVELHVRGHVVADLVASCDSDGRVVLEALTLCAD
jgi:hypothetical protein